MGLKLEFILVAFVIGLITMAMTIKINNSKHSAKVHTVEMEFTHTTSTEVDTNKTLSVTYGTYGVRDAGVLTIENLRYHSAEIELLRAKKGKMKGDMVYLDHNVSVHKEAGSDYYTEHARYNKKTGILNVTAPFKAVMGKNVMYGDTLRYDTKRQKAYATQVDATIVTAEK